MLLSPPLSSYNHSFTNNQPHFITLLPTIIINSHFLTISPITITSHFIYTTTTPPTVLSHVIYMTKKSFTSPFPQFISIPQQHSTPPLHFFTSHPLSTPSKFTQQPLFNPFTVYSTRRIHNGKLYKFY